MKMKNETEKDERNWKIKWIKTKTLKNNKINKQEIQ